MAAKREHMIKWVLEDLLALRKEKCALLANQKARMIDGYINCMWHKEDLNNQEWIALRALVDNAEMYALRECLY